MTTGIYQIENLINRKKYIGSSVNIYNRLANHISHLKKGDHANDYLQKAFNKYGYDNFKFSTLLECDENDLLFYEDLVINGYKTNLRKHGYNLREVAASNKGMRTKRNTHKSGDKYNYITLIEPTDILKNGSRYWICRCDCGIVFTTTPYRVRSGHTRSCGCLNLRRLRERIRRYNENNNAWNKGLKMSRPPWNKGIKQKDYVKSVF